MTNAALMGKPDAGNPHVRFDEGEVASGEPRRGSLLYKICPVRNLPRIAAVGALGFAALLPVPAQAAETVAEVLLAIHDHPCRYLVDSDGNWNYKGYFCTRTAEPYDIKRHGERIYVSYKTDKTSGYIECYDLDGNDLETINGPEGVCPSRLAISPDGRYLFTGHRNGDTETAKQGLWRYTFATKTWELFGAIEATCMRGIVIDGDYIYISDRGKSVRYYEWAGEAGNSYVDCMGFSHAVYGLWINPADGLLYHCGGGNSHNYGTASRNAGGRFVKGCTTTSKVGDFTGWAGANAVIGGKYYLCTENVANGMWRLDDEATNPSTFTRMQIRFNTTTKNDWLIMDLCVIDRTPGTTYAFDESAGSVTGAGKVWPRGDARFGATGVSGRGLYFAGAKSCVELGDSADAFLGKTNDFAVSFYAGLPAVASDVGGRTLLSNAAGQTGALSIVADPDAGHLNKIGLVYRSSDGTDQVLATDLTVADGAWHHVYLVRTGITSLKLYLDGDEAGTLTVGAGESLSQAFNWYLGSRADERSGFCGEGAFFDELCVFAADQIPYRDQRLQLAAAHSKADVPSAPAAPASGGEAMPGEYGTQIAHASTADAPFGEPGLCVASDGTWYVSVDRANGAAAWDQQTTVLASTDRGASWVTNSTIPAAGVSLVDLGGVLTAVGLKVASGVAAHQTCAVWQLASGVWSEVVSLTPGYLLTASAGRAALANGKLGKAVSVCKNLFSGEAELGYFSFDVSGSEVSNPTFSRVVNFENGSFKVFSTIRRMLPPTLIATDASTVRLLGPVEDAAIANTDVVVSRERCYQRTFTHYSTAKTRPDSVTRDHWRLPGAAKSFDVQYDATSGLYYALTTPVLSTDETADAGTIRNCLALYASPDLYAWYPCGTVAQVGTAATVGFNGPKFAIDGADLVIVAGVACADGAGFRSTAHSTYLMTRRVANFRTAHPPQYPTNGRRMLVSSNTSSMLMKLYQTKDGDWFSDGVFADANTVGKTIGVTSMAVGPRHVYAASRTSSGGKVRCEILEFTVRGQYKGSHPLAEGIDSTTFAVAVSADERYCYAYVAGQPYILRASTSDWEWQNFYPANTDKSETGIYRPFHLTGGPDGKLYASEYGNQGRVYAIDAEGTASVVTSSTDSEPMTVSFSADGGELYIPTCYGSYHRYDFSTATRTQIFAMRSVRAVSPAWACAVHGGLIYGAATLGWIYTIDPSTGEENRIFPAFQQLNGIGFVNVRPAGLAIIIR